MIFVGVGSLLPPPIWNAENEQGWHVVHWASAAAIFIGWYTVSITPSLLPTIRFMKIAGTSTTSATFAVRWNAGDVAVATEVPRRDSQHDERARHQRREDHME